MNRRRDIILWLLLIILAGSSIYRLIKNRYNIRTSLITGNNNTYNLAGKINPNEASWASMARLPGIGIGKAKAIVRYRQQWRERNKNGENPFKEDKDLCKINGIGEKTVEKIKEYIYYD